MSALFCSRSRVVALAATMFLSTACGNPEEEIAQGVPGDDGAGAPAPAEVLSMMIGPMGGELVAAEGSALEGFRLVVPAGALATPVELRVEGTVDPTPLPEGAQAIGPHFTILPAGVAFAVPAQLTLPFDSMLRGAWETPDEECKIWYRTGAGWARAEAIASSPTSVTVSLSETTTAGAGVLTTPRTLGCAFSCGATAAPVANCRDGDRWCLSQLGTQHVSDVSGWYSYSRGTLFWVTSPSSGNVAIAGFDVLNRRALETTGNMNLGTIASTAGEVVVDRNGARWLGFQRRGNVRFELGRLATMFDAFSSSTLLPQAAGIGFDNVAQQPIRFRATAVPGSSSAGTALSQRITAVRDGSTFDLGIVRALGAAINSVQVHQPGRASTAASSFHFAGPEYASVGTFALRNQPSAINFVANQCAGQPLREVRAFTTSPTGNSTAFLCVAEDQTGALIARGATRASFLRAEMPSGKLAVDADGNAYLADMSRPQITRFTTDGGVTVVPLTSEASTSPEYNRMIPRTIHYDSGLDTLYIVTRGTGTGGQIWEISDLR